MMEFRGEPGALVDLNPRFWGPLLLDLTSRAGVLRAYFQEVFGRELDESLICSESPLYVVPSLLAGSVSINGSLLVDDPHTSRDDVWIKALGWNPNVLGGDW
jgi:hypothetical protein